MKVYQYQTIVIEDRGHLTDPVFLKALNEQGGVAGVVSCPLCGEMGHSVANGWKHREEQPLGAAKLAVLLEREVEISGAHLSGNK